MTPVRTLALALPAALLAACGGGTADPAFVDAAPTYGMLSLDMTPADAASPGALSAAESPVVQALGADACHPFLFARTWSLVHRVNRHLYKLLRHVEAAMARDPVLATEGEHVWEKTLRGDVSARFTMTRTGELYTWKLELRSPAVSDWVVVFTGSVDRSGAAGPHQGTGEMTLDLTALKTVVPAEPVSGLLAVPRFSNLAGERLLVVDARDVQWDFGPTPALDPNWAPRLLAPQNAHYVYFRQLGKGGSLKIADDMVFACPPNPDGLPSDTRAVVRWYQVAPGEVHGRADALFTGGQLGATQSVVGLACHQHAVDELLPEGYWLMKLEDGGAVAQTWGPIGSPGACDPEFGPVPAPDSTAGDFDFAAVRFDDEVPYPFPGMAP